MTLSFSPRLRDFDTTPLDSFLADKDICHLKDHFFTHNGEPFLTLIIQYNVVGKQTKFHYSSDQEAKSTRVDPKELLSDEQWPLFETLRQWRRERGKQEGIPLYLVFKNQELIELIQKRPASMAQLQTIPGIGKAKAAKYGEEILPLIPPLDESQSKDT